MYRVLTTEILRMRGIYGYVLCKSSFGQSAKKLHYPYYCFEASNKYAALNQKRPLAQDYVYIYIL